MDIFETRNYRLNKLFLYYVGQWPRQSTKERNFFRTTTILIAGSIILPAFIKLIEVVGNLKETVDSLAEMSVYFRFILKYFNCTVNAKKMTMLVNQIEENWTIRTADFERIILESYAQRGRTISVVYMTYVGLSLAAYLSLPLIPLGLDLLRPLNETRTRIFPYAVEYFVDEDDKYFFILGHAWFSTPFCIAAIVASDTFFAVSAHHACSIFAMLGARLENIGRRGDTKKCTFDDSETNADQNYDDIVTCIKIHQNAVEFTQLLESSACICYFFVVGTSMLSMTLTAFTAVMNIDQPEEALRYMAFVVAEIVHLFYLSWQGHVLVEHSEDIFVSAYNVFWYDLSPQAKKLLILIMIRSSESCKLTAGKIFVFSMPSFATALKTSWSYFTVLVTTQ